MKKIKIVLKRQNEITKEIYEDVLEYNEDIQELDLSNMSLIEIPKGLEQFKNLKYLYLENNKISKIENLDNNVKLTHLFLTDNEITRIENIHHLDKLEYLYVFDVFIKEDIKEILKISLNNHLLEQKELQIQQELLKQQKMKQDKEYFNKNFKEIHQQFINSNNSNNNDLLI